MLRPAARSCFLRQTLRENPDKEDYSMYRFLALSLFLLTTSVTAQSRDVIYYLDRASKSDKVLSLEGTIVEDSINGLRVKPLTGPEKTLHATDIVDVAYALPRQLEVKFQNIVFAEATVRAGTADRSRLQQLLRDYNALVDQLRDPKLSHIRRHVNYRMAMLKIQLAETTEELRDAAANLGKFRSEFLESWQYVPVLQTQAQLWIELGRLEDAANVLDALARTPKLDSGLKHDVNLQIIDLMLRSQQPREAEGRATDELSSLPMDHPSVPVLKLYQIAAQNWRSDLEQAVARLRASFIEAENSTLKAVGYNLLGHLYSSKGRLEDAMWCYLWVDTVYNQDRREQLKAIERLAAVFAELNDETRAEKYREKLRTLRGSI
jgi:tetratricopeptide (TPR) repeat protein